MNCPVCGLAPTLKGVEEHEGYSIVTRYCPFCNQDWEFTHRGNSITIVTQKGMEEDVAEYGFDYECSHCRTKSYVATVLRTKSGWKCIKCGGVIPQESIKPRQNFILEPYTTSRGTSTRSSKQGSPSLTRAPRASRPLPEGAVSLSQVASDLEVEPKKLRSWLRKSNWRSSEEAGSSWVFSPQEVEELRKTFRK